MTHKTSTPDNYRIPTTHRDGAVEFSPDHETGEEQVDFHLSTLKQFSRTAAELAISAHPADPNELDNGRLERPLGELATVIPLAEKLQLPPHKAVGIYGQYITGHRRQALADAQPDTDSHKAA